MKKKFRYANNRNSNINSPEEKKKDKKVNSVNTLLRKYTNGPAPRSEEDEEEEDDNFFLCFLVYLCFSSLNNMQPKIAKV